MIAPSVPSHFSERPLPPLGSSLKVKMFVQCSSYTRCCRRIERSNTATGQNAVISHHSKSSRLQIICAVRNKLIYFVIECCFAKNCRCVNFGWKFNRVVGRLTVNSADVGTMVAGMKVVAAVRVILQLSRL